MLNGRLKEVTTMGELSLGMPKCGCNLLMEVAAYRGLSNDPGEVDSSFFCYAATVLSPHRNVLIFTQRMHKPT